MGNIGKRTAMDEGCCMFGGLHEVRMDGIHEQHEQRAYATKVAHIERFALAGYTQQDVLKAFAKVVHICGKTKDSHNLGSRSDIESRFSDHTIAIAQSRYDISQRTVVHIHHTSPINGLQLLWLALMAEDIVVDKSRYEVVGRSDGMHIACEMKVYLLHWQHLRIATARSATLHAKAWSHAWLT